MTKNKKGFTIIEVVLVLAIAGLIFLMVFIALPALQRSQRNTQREDDLSRFITAVNDYQSNNNGKTPFQTDGKLVKFTQKYIDSSCQEKKGEDGNGTGAFTECGAQFTDPDGTTYEWSVATADSSDTGASEKVEGGDVDHKLYVYNNARCGDDEGTIKYDSGVRNFALLYKLEGGAVSCNDNQ